MPKLLLAFSELKKKDRKAATSMQNLKKLIEERIAKEAEDVKYTVLTLNTKMKLANVLTIINGSQKSLAKHEGAVTLESWTVDPAKTRGKWEIETLELPKKEKKSEEPTDDAPKKKKKKKKKAKE